MSEYSTALLAHHPWLGIGLVIAAVSFLLLPRRLEVTRVAGRSLLIYDAPLLHYERRRDGWTLRLPLIARVQQAACQLLGGVWRNARASVQAALWAALEQLGKGA